MVSFFSGEDSPSTDTSHFISLLPEAMPFRSFWATLYIKVSKAVRSGGAGGAVAPPEIFKAKKKKKKKKKIRFSNSCIC